MPEVLRYQLSDPAKVGRRLDAVLAEALPELSRSRLQVLIRQGQVRVAGQRVKVRQPAVLGEEVVITIAEGEPSVTVAEAMALKVLYEDEHLLVLDKPSGLVVHPGAGHASGTLVNALLAHCDGLSTVGGVERSGIVHRLDKDTSGCMVVAKHDGAHEHLVEQFAKRRVEKHYLAVARGRPVESNGRLESFLGRHPVNRQKMSIVDEERGKVAVTDYHCGPCLNDATLVHCRPHTGRTHQIRVHLHGLGHPLLGDSTYGRGQSKAPPVDRLMLHSWILGFTHPSSGERLRWRAEIPEAFLPWLTDAEWLEVRAAPIFGQSGGVDESRSSACSSP